MSNPVSLTATVRANLSALQDIAAQQTTTAQHLSTGKKVSSALDSPVNFFTAAGLTSRASQLNGLLDGISNGIQTIQAANKGITAITSLVQQLQSTVKQARQDTTGTVTAGTAVLTTAANTSTAGGKLTFSVGGQDVAIDTVSTSTSAGSAAVPTTATGTAYTANNGPNAGAGSFQIKIGSGTAQPVNYTATDTASDIATKINTAAGSTIATATSGTISLSVASGASLTLTDGTGGNVGSLSALGFTAGTISNGSAAVAAGTVTTPLTTDQLVTAINSNGLLAGKVTATKDATTGKLSLANNTVSDIAVKGFNGTTLDGLVGTTGTLTAGTAALSSTRQSLANQFNSLTAQLDKISSDAGYNGINLLQGDHLKVAFNEKTGTAASAIDISLKKSDSTDFGTVNSFNLGIGQAATTNSGAGTDFKSNTALDSLSDTLTNALTSLTTQSSALGANLSVVQTRQDFSKQIIDVLTTGAGNLTDADMNEEAANSQALSTRQSIGISALSLSNTANQGILQLLR